MSHGRGFLFDGRVTCDVWAANRHSADGGLGAQKYLHGRGNGCFGCRGDENSVTGEHGREVLGVQFMSCLVTISIISWVG